jgi:transcriptional regulator PpsR
LEQCVGKLWIDTVTNNSRSKVQALLSEAIESGRAKWREVTHPSKGGKDIPFLYAAFRADADGRVIAFGRDFRGMALLQQRLMDAQLSMERDYWRLRHAETRYRLLFQMSSEAIFVIDAVTQNVEEANASVGKLMSIPPVHCVGRRFPEGFDAASTDAIETLLAKVRVAGRADDIRVRLADTSLESNEFMLTASMFRQDQSSYLLVRLSPSQVSIAGRSLARNILDAVEYSADGFVVTTLEGRILSANRTFLDLAQISDEDHVRNESLERWLGRSEVDFNVMMANLRQRGSVRLFATALRGADDSMTDVEVSAVAVPHGESPCMGFTIRSLGGRVVAGFASGSTARTSGEHVNNSVAVASLGGMPRSVEQLTELVGRVPMRELVGETTDLIEKLCIEAALNLTEDNRAAAAEMLGLSRQSLYVKLRRYGLGDLPPDINDPGGN